MTPSHADPDAYDGGAAMTTSDTDTTQTPLLSIKLRDGSEVALWPNRLTAPSGAYPLAQLTVALLVADPAAPPLPNGLPAPAVQLRLADGRAPVLTPADPPDANRPLAPIPPPRPEPPQRGLPPPPPPPGYGPGLGPNYVPPMPRDPSGERTLAGIAHLSVFFAPIILPLIVWLTQLDTAPYAARQGKQALFWHLIFWVVTIVLVGIPYIGFFTSFASSASSFGPDNALDPFSFFGPFLLAFGIAGLLSLVNITFSIIGAVKAFKGEPFHYPLLG